jgi:FkbM family methyltransferase
MSTRYGKGNVADEFLNVCYSQLGEDQIVDHFFSCVVPTQNGNYADVGCHHPKKFSNTYALYMKGWSGVCIDADIELKDLYQAHRPNDIFVPSGVGRNSDILTYYMFENAAANTLDPKIKDEFLKKGWRLVGEKQVPVQRLDYILKQHFDKPIDYLNIDVEGLDYEVLDTFDFSECLPKLISVETNIRDLSSMESNNFYIKLSQLGYYPYSHCVITTFFALKKRL